MINRLLKILFVLIIVRPVILLLLGLNVRNRHDLPQHGPAIIAANHNSHLDTLVVFYLYPLSQLHRLRPVAAADYFLKNPVIAWFATRVIGIIPLSRSGEKTKQALFSKCYDALDNDEILIIFPEGSRGEPEQTTSLKKGIYYLIQERKHIPIIPLVTHGLGRTLPKGEALFVPFNCDINIGEPITQVDSAPELLAALTEEFSELLEGCFTFRKEKESIK